MPGTKIRSMAFSNHHNRWFAILCFVDCLDSRRTPHIIDGNSHLVPGHEWEPFSVQVEMC